MATNDFNDYFIHKMSSAYCLLSSWKFTLMVTKDDVTGHHLSQSKFPKFGLIQVSYMLAYKLINLREKNKVKIFWMSTLASDQ